MNSVARDMDALTVKSYDKVLLIVMLLLLAFGSLMIYSSTSVITPLLAKRNITEFYYFKRHILTVFLGSLALLFTYSLRPEVLKRFSFALLIFSFVLLCLVFLPHVGVTAGGARRWIRLWPTTFQPSELVKLAMVVFLARYMSSPKYRRDSVVSFLVPIGIMGLFQVVFLRQPDFGATMSLGLITMAMLLLSGIRL